MDNLIFLEKLPKQIKLKKIQQWGGSNAYYESYCKKFIVIKYLLRKGLIIIVHYVTVLPRRLIPA